MMKWPVNAPTVKTLSKNVLRFMIFSGEKEVQQAQHPTGAAVANVAQQGTAGGNQQAADQPPKQHRQLTAAKATCLTYHSESSNFLLFSSIIFFTYLC